MLSLRRAFSVAALLLACMVSGMAAAATASPAEGALHKVRVQLKWYHQFQFAGFYAALDQGYFRRAGLDVELIEGGPNLDPVQSVTSGMAEFGIGNSSLLLDFNRGRPVVAVAAIFQHSPFVILARHDANLRSVKDLEGKTVMGETHSAELTAYMEKAGVDLRKIRFVPHTGTVASLAQEGPDQISATTAYISTEPFEAARHGIAYKIFNPRDLQIDFYGDTLFTRAQFAKTQPDVVKAMRDALTQGWRYALTHQSDVIDLIVRQYHPKMDRASLSQEAQSIYNLLQSDVVDIGYMSKARWHDIGTVFAETGLLSPNFKLDGFFIEQEAALPDWAQQAFWLGGVAVVLGGLITAYILSLNRRLHASLKLQHIQTRELERVNKELAQLSTTDHLTRLFNRRYFDETLESELARAGRNATPITLLIIDVDNFKSYNDKLGHPAGDACLQKVANALQRNVRRAGEFVARIGGEEFAVVTSLPSADEVIALAERLRQEIIALDIQHASSPTGTVTISIGATTIMQHSGPISAKGLIAQADAALYQAKNQGRNRTVSVLLESPAKT